MSGGRRLPGIRHRRCRTRPAASSESECPTRDSMAEALDASACPRVPVSPPEGSRSEARARVAERGISSHSATRGRTAFVFRVSTERHASPVLPRVRCVLRRSACSAPLGGRRAAGALAAPTSPRRTDRAHDLRAFRPTSVQLARGRRAHRADRARRSHSSAEPGTGVLVNVPTDAAKGHLLTTWEHGDLDLSLDVMLPKTSNSGMYLMGRYEVQLFDSWGVGRRRSPTWAGSTSAGTSRAAPGSEGYEGTPPRAEREPRARALAASRDLVPRAEVRGEDEGRQRALPPRRPQRRHRAGERRGHRPDARRAVHRRARDRSADDPGRSRSRRGAQHRVQVVHRRRRSCPT